MLLKLFLMRMKLIRTADNDAIQAKRKSKISSILSWSKKLPRILFPQYPNGYMIIPIMKMIALIFLSFLMNELHIT